MRHCRVCGCYEPFVGVSDNSCWAKWGRSCHFVDPTDDVFLPSARMSTRGPSGNSGAPDAGAAASSGQASQGSNATTPVAEPRAEQFPAHSQTQRQPNGGRGESSHPDGRPQARRGLPLEVIAVAEEGEKMVLWRPCVDCGLRTGCFCDICLGVERLPHERWLANQHTPLCSRCDRRWDMCHFCRGLEWTTPPARGPVTPDGR